MLSEITLRLLVAGGIILSGAGLYWVGKRLLLARIRGRVLGLESLKPGIPAVLYFTTPDCVPCRTYQRPELQKLQAELGRDLQIVEVDATERPDLADYWGVLSVPTSFIIDSEGRARGMNFGAASAAKLYQQLCEAESKNPRYGFSEGGVS
ncbi:MAG TPA: thioredoxin family protein [Anaerolineales bacterium]|nr:thioredoxin family protein [Anaerolineales bacterium]